MKDFGWIAFIKEIFKRKQIPRNEELVKNCFEQFSKLISKGLSLPIKTL